MPQRRAIALPGGTVVHTAFTATSDGDLRVGGPPGPLQQRRAAVAPGPWTWLHQVHGARVVVVSAPGERAGEEADAAVTTVPGAVLAVHTADCAGVLLWGTDTAGSTAAIGAAHAGWRGLEAGVLEATVDALRACGAEHVRWQAGPCISGPAYEFGAEDLERLVARHGPTLRTTTAQGRPALDLRAGVRAALAATGASEEACGPDICTATGEGHYSWRARADQGRQAAVIRMAAL